MISLQELTAIFFYLMILLSIGVVSARRHQTATDFLIGGRSLNFYLTAFSAHASDMSAWLFMGLPAQIFLKGVFEAWFAVGLLFFMFFNWLLVAPRIRLQTEKYRSVTFSSFFESRLHDTSGVTRLLTAVTSLLFYAVYLTAGAVAMGEIIEVLFHIDYHTGMTIGLSLVGVYLLIGGYRTLAWVDCFQALFLLAVVILIPLFVFFQVGGYEGIVTAFHKKALSLSLLPGPNRSFAELSFLLLSWGIGYFGQPHIATKFMGIGKASDLRKSMGVGMSWQLLALGGATFIGIVAVPFFQEGLFNPEYAFIEMVRESFHPFASALILCAVLAAILSTMDSQMLVLASSLTEDFYKRTIRKNANSQEILWISRLCILLVIILVYGLALFRVGGGSIYWLVSYGWSGLGASFGPLLLFTLFAKKVTKWGAWLGVVVGGGTVSVWFACFDQTSFSLPVAFFLGSIAIYLGSRVIYRKEQEKEKCDSVCIGEQ